MATDEHASFLAGAANPSESGRSVLDQSVREVLLRAIAREGSRRNLLLHGINQQPLEAATVASLLELGRTELYDIQLFHALERERSDVASVARFGHRVECASFHLFVAFDKANVEDFELPVARNVVKPTRGIR